MKTTTTKTEKALRKTFSTMNADRAQQIEDAYYKAIEGLRELADALEIAEAETPGPTNENLMNEHFLACEAIETMKRSVLGQVL